MYFNKTCKLQKKFFSFSAFANTGKFQIAKSHLEGTAPLNFKLSLIANNLYTENLKREKKREKKKLCSQRSQAWMEGVFSFCTGSFKIKTLCRLVRIINLFQWLNLFYNIFSV
jgi:hypothetical protein